MAAAQTVSWCTAQVTMTRCARSQIVRRHSLAPAATLVVFAAALSLAFIPGPATLAQKRQRPTKPKPKVDLTSELARSNKELARLQAEFINATKEYKANLIKLKASYERDVSRAEAELVKSKDLFAAGLISKKDLEAGERNVAAAKDKVAEADRNSAAADTQIADTLLEADAEAKLRKSKPIAKGAIVSTAAMIRFNGGGAWVLSDAWKVQRFFQQAFNKQLPISVFGQGSIHVRWRLDHNNSMDVSLHPDGAEGQAVLGFLRSNGIPFLAFRQAIPGTATGPHIHIGRPSHRY